MRKLLPFLIASALVLSIIASASAQIYVYSSQGRAAETYPVNSTDTAQGISAAVLAAGNSAPIAALITCETNAVRFAFGGATPTAAFGHVLAADKSIRIVGGNMVRSFEFISETAASAALLHITVEYE